MSSQTRKQSLQGPRPAPLTVSKSSTMIKKSLPSRKSRSPVIIYLQSPKVIHVRPEDFMGIVQRLTGNQAVSVAAASHSYSSTSCVTMADETMGMEISSEGQQNYHSGIEYGVDPALGIPPKLSNFAAYPIAFYVNTVL